MRAARLVSMVLLLQAREVMTAAELAGELEVSERTVYRDALALAEAGVPVYAERGRTGGYRLIGGYRTRLTGLNRAEAEALFLSGLPGPLREMGLAGAAVVAQLKVAAALNPELRDAPAAAAQRFHLDAPGWFHDGEPPRHLAELAAAVWNQQRMRVSYRRWNNTEVERTLEPLGVVLKAGVWYVVAKVPTGGEPRTYRASRVLAAQTLDDRFERPAGFELETYWLAWTQRLPRLLFHGEATVRFAPRAVELSFLLGPVMSRAVRAAAERPDPDGWVTAVIPIESVEHALHDLLRFGPDAEVLEPRQLRARIADAAHGLVRLYDLQSQ